MLDFISICIPCYEMNGNGVKFLTQLLQTIEKQTYKNFEVVISDHSENTEIEAVSEKYKHLNTKFFKNNKSRGSSSANINNALDNASGDLIKIMFQDDFFVNVNALDYILKLPEKSNWGVCGCVHSDEKANSFYNRLVPYWQNKIKNGVNTIGGPSVTFFKPTGIRFDERLLWYMDTDFYVSMHKEYGDPYIEPKALICSRETKTRVSSTLITDKVVKTEELILKEKYHA